MTKKYEIIYADPPWQYNSSDNLAEISLLNEDDNHHYPTMPLSDLKNVDVQSFTADNCLIFMWVVSPMLDDGIELLKHWGFDYATVGFVWHKQRTNPGYYTMSQVEMCIIGKKGKIPTPRGARNIKQFLSLPRGKHSQKPHEVRERIELMFPTQAKLEMFARCASDDWDVWGNEFDNDIEIGDTEKRVTFDGYREYFE